MNVFSFQEFSVLRKCKQCIYSFSYQEVFECFQYHFEILGMKCEIGNKILLAGWVSGEKTGSYEPEKSWVMQQQHKRGVPCDQLNTERITTTFHSSAAFSYCRKC